MRKLAASRITEESCAAFYEILNKSDRPLIYAGGGVINSGAAEELRAFARTLRIPTVTTLLGIGAMDTTDDLSLHMVGMHGMAYANYAVEDCDFLIAVGARFDDRVAGKVNEFAPKARYIAHIDIDAAEIGKVKIVQWAHVGDARTALEDLLEGRKGFRRDFSKWLTHVQKLKKKHARNYNRESNLIQPQYVIEWLNEIIHGEAIVTTGVGQHQMWAAQYFDFRHPRSFLTSGSMGTMGFGLPAAIGAQLACPNRMVIDIDGDGSLRMNLGELETVTTYNLPVKVILFNNLGDGMVRQWQKMYFGNRFSASDKSLHQKVFTKSAEADGFTYSVRLAEKEKVPEVLTSFVEHRGPAFLEVMIDPDAAVYPMVGPGMGYKDMVTGDFIPSRQASAHEPDVTLDMTKIPDLF
jgi:acetolactate synthase-1/2/3 large subunit